MPIHTLETKLTRLKNGLVIIGEQIPDTETVAYSLLIPTGAVNDPSDKLGQSKLLAQLLNRGAGGMNERQLSEAFEDCGILGNIAGGQETLNVFAVMRPLALERSLELHANILKDPLLPEEDLEILKTSAIHDLRALHDSPSSLATERVSALFYPAPFGRSSMGTEEGIAAVTRDSLLEKIESGFCANGTIIALAGNFDWDKAVSSIERYFGDWTGEASLSPVPEYGKEQQIEHVYSDSSQTHIALQYPWPKSDSPHRDAASVAEKVLSGGLYSRLFNEVRAKRSLCYSISAGHGVARDRGRLSLYVGTSPDTAQLALDTALAEFEKLERGVTDDELESAQVSLESELIMRSSRGTNRVQSLASTYFVRREILDLDELYGRIKSVNSEDITKLCQEFPVRGISLAVVGPEELSLPARKDVS